MTPLRWNTERSAGSASKPFATLLRASTILLVFALQACGFQLRESADLPEAMSKTHLRIDDEYGQFSRRIQQMLRQNGVEFVALKDATAVLDVPVNRVTRDVLTIGDNARVREYRITHTVQFQLTDRAGGEIVPMQTLKQSREISFDEQAILAASREQEYLEQDLANNLSRLLVNRLGSARD
jgi:LPS-assembly lipoprotein